MTCKGTWYWNKSLCKSTGGGDGDKIQAWDGGCQMGRCLDRVAVDVNFSRCQRRQTCARDIPIHHCHLRRCRCCHRWPSISCCCSCRCVSAKYCQNLSCLLSSYSLSVYFVVLLIFFVVLILVRSAILAVWVALVRSTSATTIVARLHLSGPAVGVDLGQLGVIYFVSVGRVQLVGVCLDLGTRSLGYWVANLQGRL